MSVNLIHAVDQKKVRHYGRLWATIDFQSREDLSVDLIQKMYLDTVIGTFEIGGKQVPVTLRELERIAETAITAQQVFRQKYRMGSYGRR
jgi:hypothetical protein